MRRKTLARCCDDENPQRCAISSMSRWRLASSSQARSMRRLLNHCCGVIPRAARKRVRKWPDDTPISIATSPSRTLSSRRASSSSMARRMRQTVPSGSSGGCRLVPYRQRIHDGCHSRRRWRVASDLMHCPPCVHSRTHNSGWNLGNACSELKVTSGTAK